MKVLVVHPGPHFSVADVHSGLVKGLEQNGCEVGVLNLDDRLSFYHNIRIERNGVYEPAIGQSEGYDLASQGIELACYEWWPDMVIVVSGWFIPPRVWAALARRPHHTVFWATESPYEDDRQAQPARYVDTVILNDPTNVKIYREDINARTFYLPHSYDPDIHHPGPADPDLECDFGFTGTGWPSRYEFFEAVDWTGLDVKLGGNWKFLDDDSPLHQFLAHDITDGMPNEITADLYRSAKVGANLYRKEHSDNANAEGWATGPREVEMAACGSFFLREPRGEGDDLFPMLPTFTNSDEFAELLRWYLDHPEERHRAAVAAREAIEDRTFKNTAGRLLELAGQDLPATTLRTPMRP